MCEATVKGLSPTGVVSWLTSGPGDVTLSPMTCVLSSGRCQVQAFGRTAGGLTLNASYGGDLSNLPSSSAIGFTVSPIVQVKCTPSTVVVGTPSKCRASVPGTPPATGRVRLTASGSGRFSPASCALSEGSCAVSYTPFSASSPVNVSASYSGDRRYSASSQSDTITVTTRASKTVVSCAPAKVSAAATRAMCIATVTGYLPAGTVSWSQGGIGTVNFTSGTCGLMRGRCSVVVVGANVGAVAVRARYGGDPNNAGSSGTAPLLVKPARPSLSVWCSSSSVTAGGYVYCTATLKNYSGPVQGELVSWGQSGGSGRVSVSSLTCAMSAAASCAITVWAGSPGGVILKAAFSGDSDNAAASGSRSLTVT